MLLGVQGFDIGLCVHPILVGVGVGFVLLFSLVNRSEHSAAVHLFYVLLRLLSSLAGTPYFRNWFCCLSSCLAYVVMWDTWSHGFMNAPLVDLLWWVLTLHYACLMKAMRILVVSLGKPV